MFIFKINESQTTKPGNLFRYFHLTAVIAASAPKDFIGAFKEGTRMGVPPRPPHVSRKSKSGISQDLFIKVPLTDILQHKLSCLSNIVNCVFKCRLS